MQKKTIIIIHGMSGTKNDHWYGWIEQRLVEKGYNVIPKTFPNNLESSAEVSVDFVIRMMDNLEGVSFIIHSSGCAVAFRIAEQQKVDSLYIVSGLFEDLGYTPEIKSKLFHNGFDFEEIKKNTKRIIQIDSDDDPYITTDHFNKLADHLNSNHIVLTKRRHFGDSKNSPKTFSELLNLIV